MSGRLVQSFADAQAKFPVLQVGGEGDTASLTSFSADVSTPTPRTAVINSPYGLNLRAEPGTNTAVLTFLAADTVVTLLDGRETADNLTWQQIEVDGQIGWVSEQFLTRP